MNIRLSRILFEGKTYRLYHGTSLKNAKAIHKTGFSFAKAGEKSGAPMPGISFSLDIDIAKDHAKWAAKKYKDKPAVLVANVADNNITTGELYFSFWNQFSSSETAINKIKEKGYNGVFLFDPETGEGAEEQEVLLFDYNDKPEIITQFLSSNI